MFKTSGICVTRYFQRYHGNPTGQNHRGLRPWKSFYQRCSGGSSPSHVARWVVSPPGEGDERFFPSDILIFERSQVFLSWYLKSSWILVSNTKPWRFGFMFSAVSLKTYVILKMSPLESHWIHQKKRMVDSVYHHLKWDGILLAW